METPPQAAIDHGHDLESDPPAAMAAVDRWTCRRCGQAALRYGPSGHEYGGAVEDPCTPTT